MRYKITFSYDGSNFSGYQKQPKLRTVQGELEKALKYINNNKDTVVTSSGRTDALVHAHNQVCHVDIDVSITPYKLKRAINSLTPDDIYVKNVEKVDDEFHARYFVKSKEYIYKINTSEYDPLNRNYIYQYNKKLDIKQMKKALKYFKGTHDFKCFTSGEEKENTIRTIFKVKIEEKNNIITIKFIGSGFLKYMVRIMVGTLIKVGENKIKPEYIKELLLSEKRIKKKYKAPANGLYLNKIEYKKES